ncbi:uncharacterized protein LOC124494240 [Dermatophagoides farinae]|uniref:Uncharacterized protein n=1 Tax=Dermatophagoides farinae TaxID=6954 RepID=A0A922KXT3_DERFA|nr:uncharacterized protein LOC124494240 [Dermatophagoides farinae]KAH7644011.1 hypothetical protein HUG17_6373 [Dermatophagoides farinae]KAH9494305.1 hypothetical protein DERF_015000 [Dermatophagoides farinae]
MFQTIKTSTILVLMMATILVSAQSYSSPTKNIIQQQYEPSGGSSGSDEFGHERMVGRVIPLAVKTRQTFDFIPVDIPMERTEPYIIEVGANSLPLVMQFKSASSRLQIEQNHAGSGLDRMVETTSEDQPKHLRHKVVKPIIQEVREIIKPYRRIIQEIQPVTEDIKTIIAQKQDSRAPTTKHDEQGGFTGSSSFDGTKHESPSIYPPTKSSLPSYPSKTARSIYWSTKNY